MVVNAFGSCMLVRPVQPANALLPITVSEFGNTTPVRPVQLRNAPLPKPVNPIGRVIVPVNPLQLRNASLPIDTSVLGKFTVVRCILPLNVLAGIAVTPSGTVMVVRLVQPRNIPKSSVDDVEMYVTVVKLVG